MNGRDRKPDPSAAKDAELAARLRALDRRLDERRAKDGAPATDAAQSSGPGMGMALRLAADFVAGVVLGLALGWGFDRLFGTSPWGLMVFMLLGFAAGILSVLRSAGLVAPPERRLRDERPGDDERD